MIKLFTFIAYDEIDKLSVSSFYYKGYKYGGSRLGRQSSRLSNYSWINTQKHGIASPAKEDINEIMHHSYMYDNQKAQAMYANHQALRKISKVLPKVPTKASKLRDEHLKNEREKLANSFKNDSKPQWKLRQFLGIGPSEGIVQSIKMLKKRQNKPQGVHNFEPEALPDISDQANNDYVHEKVDKKLKDKLLSDYFSEKRQMSSKRSQY